MMSPKFTFIIPSYNGMPYIKDCIESILSQTYTNFNVVVLESMSIDGTFEYLKSVDDPRLSIVQSSEKMGIEGNWSRIKDVEKGEFMLVTGQDDKYTPDYLEEINKLIEKYPDASLYRTGLYIIDEKSDYLYKSDFKKLKMTAADYLEGKMLDTYFSTFAGYCFRTSDFYETGGIDCSNNLIYSDDNFIIKLLHKSYLINSKKICAYYRQHSDSVSGTPNIEAALNGYNKFFNFILDLNDKNLTSVVKKYLPFYIYKIKRHLGKRKDELNEMYKLYNINPNNIYYLFIRAIMKIRKIYKRSFHFVLLPNKIDLNFSFLKFKKEYRKSVIILRFDGIGDYVLMQNFLKSVKESNKYKGYKLIFAGRSDYEELAEKINADVVDEFIWLDFVKYMNSKKYKNRILKMFSKLKVTDVISPCYHRERDIIDPVVKCIKAKNKIGHVGPLIRLEGRKDRFKKYYTNWIETKPEQTFEFDRNKEFFEKVLNEKITLEKPVISPIIAFDKQYVFLAPFSGDSRRTWNAENFAKIADYVIAKHNCEVILLGSKYDYNKANSIIYKMDNQTKVKNAAGKIGLDELPAILTSAKLLISNETGTVHIAAAVGCPVLCISNGSFYKRFQPYNYDFTHYIYTTDFINRKDDSEFYNINECCINTIKFEDVMQKIDKIITKENRLNII